MKKILMCVLVIGLALSGMFLAPIHANAFKAGIACQPWPGFADMSTDPPTMYCPVAITINGIISCCQSAAAAPAGGTCTPCSSCGGHGGCLMICDPNNCAGSAQ